MSNWISCNERLPENNQDILVWIEDSERIAPCNYFEGKWFDAIFDRFVNPIAWMPLPEPYEKGTNNE